MTDYENEKLAKLVTYLLETGEWSKVYLTEYCETFALFRLHTSITFKTAKQYVDKALTKLLGKQYKQEQHRLFLKYYCSNDLFFKPKTLTQKRKEEQLRNAENNPIDEKTKQLKEFGEKYLAHYGYRSTKNKAQYVKEKRFFISKGFCSWEIER